MKAKNKHICMDKRQTGTNIPMRIVCVVVNKKPQSWEEMTFGRVCHAKAMGYENSKFQYHLLMHWENVSLLHWKLKNLGNYLPIFQIICNSTLNWFCCNKISWIQSGFMTKKSATLVKNSIVKSAFRWCKGTFLRRKVTIVQKLIFFLLFSWWFSSCNVTLKHTIYGFAMLHSVWLYFYVVSSVSKCS